VQLQATVEGLSVAAITYYIVGLVSYLAKGALRWAGRSAPETRGVRASRSWRRRVVVDRRRCKRGCSAFPRREAVQLALARSRRSRATSRSALGFAGWPAGHRCYAMRSCASSKAGIGMKPGHHGQMGVVCGASKGLGFGLRAGPLRARRARV
jgi:hypothetical protein